HQDRGGEPVRAPAPVALRMQTASSSNRLPRRPTHALGLKLRLELSGRAPAYDHPPAGIAAKAIALPGREATSPVRPGPTRPIVALSRPSPHRLRVQRHTLPHVSLVTQNPRC